MKRFSVMAALLGILTLAGCGNGSKQSAAPSFSWDSNAYDNEIGKSMKATLTANVPGGVADFKLTATTIPTELVGMSQQFIGNSANKSSLVFDFIHDAKTISSLKSFASVSEGATSVKMDFSKLLWTLIGEATLKDGSAFTLRVHIEDAAGNAKDFDAKFQWTSEPVFTTTGGKASYVLGEDKTVVVDVQVFAKGANTFTVTFGGNNAAPYILNEIKNRTVGNKLVVDLVNDSAACEQLGYPLVSKTAKQKYSIDFSEQVKRWAIDAQANTSTEISFAVEDVLGKTATQKITLVKK